MSCLQGNPPSGQVFCNRTELTAFLLDRFNSRPLGSLLDGKMALRPKGTRGARFQPSAALLGPLRSTEPTNPGTLNPFPPTSPAGGSRISGEGWEKTRVLGRYPRGLTSPGHICSKNTLSLSIRLKCLLRDHQFALIGSYRRDLLPTCTTPPTRSLRK